MLVKYAQTNLQLFDQLQKTEYSVTELELICDAYALAMRLYPGYFLSSGRAELSHVVGTASILASLKAPASVVAAGLIHNVYGNGDFGSYLYGDTAAKRRVLIDALGGEVEKYVRGFHALRTERWSLRALNGDIETADHFNRFVLLIDLSERVEHHLNDGDLPQYTKYMHTHGDMMVEAARKLQFPQLAEVILDAIGDHSSVNSVVRQLAKRSSGNRSQWIVPLSCRKALKIRVWVALIHAFNRIGRIRVLRYINQRCRSFASGN